MTKNEPLRLRRLTMRLSQMAVAKHAGMSDNKYWRAENGYYVPTAVERTKISALLRCPVKQIFPGV